MRGDERKRELALGRFFAFRSGGFGSGFFGRGLRTILNNDPTTLWGKRFLNCLFLGKPRKR